MLPFDFHPTTRIVFGPNKIDALGELAAELGACRALLVSDPGIEAVGHDDRGMAALRKAGLEVGLFDHLVPNPTTVNVVDGVEFARDFQPDLLVGLGGGSSMDCAKGINFVYTNGGRMQDYWGTGKATKPMLPMIAVPTTAGTGSETQSFALITDAETHVKMACGDKKAAFRVALLDPKLTITQPPSVTALTGIDAISHALESYVTTRRNAISLTFSREAWRLMESNFPRVLQEPESLEARTGMQLGACFAGLAIENSMLGATHALANPLTQYYGIPHGQAIALMLPHVVRFNGAAVDGHYAELWDISGASLDADYKDAPRADLLAELTTRLIRKAGLETRLSNAGVEQHRLQELARAATQQWTGKFNPRPVSEEQFFALYQTAF